MIDTSLHPDVAQVLVDNFRDRKLEFTSGVGRWGTTSQAYGTLDGLRFSFSWSVRAGYLSLGVFDQKAAHLDWLKKKRSYEEELYYARQMITAQVGKPNFQDWVILERTLVQKVAAGRPRRPPRQYRLHNILRSSKVVFNDYPQWNNTFRSTNEFIGAVFTECANTLKPSKVADIGARFVDWSEGELYEG